MKKLLLLLLAFLFVGTDIVFSQEDKKLSKKEQKKMEKAAREAQDMLDFEAAKKALYDHNFVLEADRVEFKRGQYKYVSANTNFVSLIGDEASVQLAFNGMIAGPNGMGGVTVDGKPSKIEVKEDKKGNVTLNMMVNGRGISASISARMSKGSSKCTATVSPNFNSNRISFTGTIYPAKRSNVYKGRSL